MAETVFLKGYAYISAMFSFKLYAHWPTFTSQPDKNPESLRPCSGWRVQVHKYAGFHPWIMYKHVDKNTPLIPFLLHQIDLMEPYHITWRCVSEDVSFFTPTVSHCILCIVPCRFPPSVLIQFTWILDKLWCHPCSPATLSHLWPIKCEASV